MAAVYSLVNCGNDTFIYIAAAVDEASKSLLSTAARHLLQLVLYCGASEVGIKAPQSFYTVP